MPVDGVSLYMHAGEPLAGKHGSMCDPVRTALSLFHYLLDQNGNDLWAYLLDRHHHHQR